MSLSRQKVPTLDRSELAPASGARARRLRRSGTRTTSPDLILIATGSEVALALDAARRLAGDGTAVRVVSMPCWELFAEQPAEYRDEVLPPDVKARLSIEAGVALGWSEWVGDDGDSIAIEHFGASAPGATVLAEFGFNVDNVVAPRFGASSSRSCESHAVAVAFDHRGVTCARPSLEALPSTT